MYDLILKLDVRNLRRICRNYFRRMMSNLSRSYHRRQVIEPIFGINRAREKVFLNLQCKEHNLSVSYKNNLLEIFEAYHATVTFSLIIWAKCGKFCEVLSPSHSLFNFDWECTIFASPFDFQANILYQQFLLRNFLFQSDYATIFNSLTRSRVSRRWDCFFSSMSSRIHSLFFLNVINWESCFSSEVELLRSRKYGKLNLIHIPAHFVCVKISFIFLIHCTYTHLNLINIAIK